MQAKHRPTEPLPSKDGAAPPAGRQRLFAGKRMIGVLAVAILLALGAVYASGPFRSGHGHSEVATTDEKYTCGMHPSIISDKPGDCPICGMALTKIESEHPALPTSSPKNTTPAKNELNDLFDDSSEAKPKPPKERKILFYRNPMNPSITSPTPAKDEMGMDYVAVYSDSVQSLPDKGSVQPPPAKASDQSPPGRGETGASSPSIIKDLATIQVGEEALRLSGVQTATALHEKEIKRTVRTVGLVVPDETRVRHIHTKIAGWIETLSTNFTGQNVEMGQPLLSIYSPELLSTQEEFLAAHKAVKNFASSGNSEIKNLGQELLQSTRRRLELFDVPQSFIAELEKTGKVQRSVTLNAPISGFVTSKGIVEGQQVEPGLELFTITDLSHVWIEADLYEYEAGAVEIGQEATLNLSYDPGIEFKGRVTYVFPYLSPDSRTLKVRFDFPNPELKLKPQMYADVTLTLAQAAGITIPDSALIDTGVRQVVFVETAPGSFEPRAVKVGIRGGGKAQIIAGVNEGEKVVMKANFLLDSESRLRAALNKVIGGSGQ